jgi:hypothetical protein
VQYCNANKTFVNNKLSDLDITHVILVTRHGDRSPVYFLRIPGDFVQLRRRERGSFLLSNQSFPFQVELYSQHASERRSRCSHKPEASSSETVHVGLFFCFFCCSKIIIIDNNRPGRNLLPGNCLLGQLTEVGAQQHRELGRNFRLLYVQQLGFLSPGKPHWEEMFLRTTDVERTILSAYNFLEGVWTASNLEAVQINTIDYRADNAFPNTGVSGAALCSLFLSCLFSCFQICVRLCSAATTPCRTVPSLPLSCRRSRQSCKR